MVKVSGKKVLPYDAQKLWRLLMDPDVLRRCMPGCERLEALGAGRFAVSLKLRYGLLRGRFEGDVALKDVVEPEGYRMVVDASGRAGYVRGVTQVELAAVGAGGTTELRYDSETLVGGLLASARGAADGAARRFVDRFFDELSRL